MKQFRKRMLASGLAVTVVLGTTTPTIKVFANQKVSNVKFSDVSENHWAKSQIDSFISEGILAGYPDGNFKPSNKITRAEFVKIINKAFGFTDAGEKSFSDINENDWYATDIKIAVKKGYINGFEDNTFRPNEEITREQMAKILGTILNVSADGQTKFTDDSSIAPWARKYVDALANNGILAGYPDGSFNPKGSATRAEGVKLTSDTKTYKNKLDSQNQKPEVPEQEQEKPSKPSTEVGGGSWYPSYPGYQNPSNGDTVDEGKVVSTQEQLVSAIQSGESKITIKNNITLTEPVEISSNQTLTVQEGKELVVNTQLNIDGTVNVNGNIKVLNQAKAKSLSKIVMSQKAKLNVNKGSSLEFSSFDDIITPNSENLLIYANSKVKVGNKVYIGQENDKDALINLTNYTGSNKPVAGFFINGDGQLLLTLFEKGEVKNSEANCLDVAVLVKAGNENTLPGELTIPNLNVISNTTGAIAVEANGSLICGKESLVSKNNSNSVFNASGGDKDNRKGVTFRKRNNSLSVSICGDATMNKGLKDVTIVPEYRTNQTYENTLDIKFDPNNDVLLQGVSNVEKATYVSENGVWNKKDESSEKAEVSTEKELIDALNNNKTFITITNDITLNKEVTIKDNQFLDIKQGKKLIVNANMNLDGRINVNKDSSLEIKNLDDIKNGSIGLHADSTVKVGEKVYVGKTTEDALINLQNHDGSTKSVAEFFRNGDGQLLLILFEKGEVKKSEEGCLDIPVLVKAGNENTLPAELTIPNLDVIDNTGAIAVEANGSLIYDGGSLVSKDSQDSVFNASGGDKDNRKGITFRKIDDSLSVSICGDATMNKGLSDVTIVPEDRGQDYENTLNINFTPDNDDVLLEGVSNVEQAEYISNKNEGKWLKKDSQENSIAISQ